MPNIVMLSNILDNKHRPLCISSITLDISLL